MEDRRGGSVLWPTPAAGKVTLTNSKVGASAGGGGVSIAGGGAPERRAGTVWNVAARSAWERGASTRIGRVAARMADGRVKRARRAAGRMVRLDLGDCAC